MYDLVATVAAPEAEFEPAVYRLHADLRPIREELLGLEHLEAHARQLAHRLGPVRREAGRPMLRQFLSNARELRRSHKIIVESVHQGEPMDGDAEWLLDNFHIISDTLSEIRTDLPRGYYKKLPKLQNGPLAGYPRVYAIAFELTAHSDGEIDETNITRFAQGFQSVAPLEIGELWAIPIMIRLCLVENLRRLAAHVVQNRLHRRRAHEFLQAREAETNGNAPSHSFDLDAVHHNWLDCYVFHLFERMREMVGTAEYGAARLEDCLKQRGKQSRDVIDSEKRRQAANQVSIGNCVTSLRVLSALNWPRFFERASFAEQLLRDDPACVYGSQDFATRDRMRQAVEDLARGSHRSELDVIKDVLQLSRSFGPESIEHHIGFHLIGDGRPAFERALRYRASLRLAPRRFVLANPNLWYFGVLIASWLGLAAALSVAAGSATPVWPLAAMLVALGLIPLSEIAVGFVNFLTLRILPPRTLPRLDFSNGVRSDHATFVVIPTLLGSLDGARSLIEKLEVHYLSNGDDNLYFALLTDFTDAPTETMPLDEELIRVALDGIRELNDRYAKTGDKRFFLFHRGRTHNPSQSCWMGWERKRGKLSEFNRFLREGQCHSPVVISDPLPESPRIRYVITLDTDTQMPREAARRLIATLAHPLNQPRFDEKLGRVVAGYGILQPRVELSLRGARKSIFTRIFTTSAGIDPYTTAVSDTYEDLFGSGSFTGKGIYEIDAFEGAVGRAFPDNRILSHDLIEGNFARCGLITEVELLDDFPTTYLAYSRREHRWVRGDWQILPWLGPRIPDSGGATRHNPLPALERWKIADNLRRSLTPVFLVAMLAFGFLAGPRIALVATAAAGITLAWPLVTSFVSAPLQIVRRAWSFWATVSQVLLGTMFLADQAFSMIDAIGRTLWRMFVSRRDLLEWETAAATEGRLKNAWTSYARHMMASPIFAILVGIGVVFVNRSALVVALPWLLAWSAAPLIAWLVSMPIAKAEAPLAMEDVAELRRLLRKTWGFFETFVRPEENWLPPDNYQEDPKGEIAHRTSPTNIGLFMVTCAVAHEFGYLSFSGMLDRLERTCDTLDTLEREHGHILNWYETRTLKPLHPKYISTVDSGNLAASLMALRQALAAKLTQSPLGPQPALGIAETIALAREVFIARKDPASQSVLEGMDKIAQRVTREPTQWSDWTNTIVAIEQELHAIDEETKSSRNLDAESRRWLEQLRHLIEQRSAEASAITSAGATADAPIADLCLGAMNSDDVVDRVHRLMARLDAFASEMDFRFLYNTERNLFAVGFNLSAGRLDTAHYDLLASEASLTSFLAIARGDVPRKHWFQLSRPLTRVGGSLCLLSWGGTMFEYLMPRLFLRSLPGTLLDESQRLAVQAQIDYGRRCKCPWGISESAFSAMDGQMTYQYQAFGVPALGLKRGLNKDLVVAPYATGLAAATAPRQVVANFEKLRAVDAEGPFGMFEALDYSADARPPHRNCFRVRCYMAHHQAMLFLGIANAVGGEIVTRWFHSEPRIRATELLLQERVPTEIPPSEDVAEESSYLPTERNVPSALSRRVSTPHSSHPRTHLLSSGSYSVLISNAGGGQSWANGLAVTRWRSDSLTELYGQFIYLRDIRTEERWSATYLPVAKEADEFEAIFSLDKAEFRRVDGTWEARLEITVSPENHAEVRRLTITNHDHKSRFIEVTSYAEMVLAPQAADVAHPAFAKLFVETEYLASEEAIICRRRPRDPKQKPIYALHIMATDAKKFGEVQYETDRARFIGRGRTVANPAAMEVGAAPLSGTTGPVLDPIVSLRRQFRVKAGASITVAFTTVLADSRESAMAIADHFHDFHGVQRAFELAWAHSQIELRQHLMTAVDTHLCQRLTSFLVYPNAAARAGAAVLAANTQDVKSLWRFGISGDLPITLVRVTSGDDLSLVRQLIAAHNFWRRRGLMSDLVLFNEHEEGYFEEVHDQLLAAIRATEARDWLDKPAGVFLRKAKHIGADDRNLLLASASIVLRGDRGALAAQVDAIERALPSRRIAPPKSLQGPQKLPAKISRSNELKFDNTFGGFTAEGREYEMMVSAETPTPQPWINVIANESFGFLISERGAGFTWAGNSQSNRLTPWSNDPVSDPPGEFVFLRDRHTSSRWSATPAPLGGGAAYRVRHGQGCSTFEHDRDDIGHALTVFTPPDEPVKVYRLRLRNDSKKPRNVLVGFFAEWVLGTNRDRTGPFVRTEIDADSGALLARNSFQSDFPNQIAFADVSARPRSVTSDRGEFIGRHGSVADPAGLQRDELSGKVGAGLDACAALQTPISLQPGATAEIVFVLGTAISLDDVRRIATAFREPSEASAALERTRQFWDRTLSAVTVETPDAALNFLMNRWLVYQVLSCRMWGRSAFYQSGGAFGFRDQLQDAMALVYSHPDVTRRHLLVAASRQFVQGDVQHWWHPPHGAGVRTRFSDDYLWLPFAVHHYVTVTGDLAVLDESVGYLDAPLLNPGQDEDYRQPEIANESDPLLVHCLKAIDHGLRFGEHGLPLMGTGDWNDGMNHVGSGGKGESVWTGWFLVVILRKFANLCDQRGDHLKADEYRRQSAELVRNLEEHAWDGGWYRRAYFDDGRPLGSSSNDACKIDSIVQSWATLSDAADSSRTWQAMVAADHHLVRRDEGLVLLFTPPFDQTTLEPGYIKGYLPGIRENGGQYTHAALWMAQAWAHLGQGDKAWELLTMLSPVTHSQDAAQAERYRLEPYVVAADIYSQPPHVGRGGWSWYTGSASWYYRVVLESLLGLRVSGTQFSLRPRIPQAWPGFVIRLRVRDVAWTIEVRRAESKTSAGFVVDGQPQEGESIDLGSAGTSHSLVASIVL